MFLKILQGILADLSNVVVFMVSSLPLISNSASLFFKLVRTFPCASTIIGINITVMFYSFFCSLVRSNYFSISSLSFSFTLEEQQNPLNDKFFLSCKLTRGLALWLGLSGPFLSQSPREFYTFHFWGRILHIPFGSIVKFHSLPQFAMDHLSYPDASFSKILIDFWPQ